MGRPQIDPGPPLAVDGKRPVVFGVLGAIFHLESLTRDDEPILEGVNAMARGWIGPELRWTSARVTPSVRPFVDSDLELIELYPRQLGNPYAGKKLPAPGPSLAAAGANNFYVACGGGARRTHASPYSYRFASVIPRPGDEPVFRTASSLFISVPSSWPLDDFYRRVCAMASKLHIRWGSAGFTYSIWEFAGRNAPRQAIYAHARRHVGFDVALGVPLLHQWHEQIRSINWLTFIGPAFAERLAKAGAPLTDTPLVRVSRFGDTTLIVAGDRQLPGDLNRRTLPPAYVVADSMVRLIRAAKGLHFLHPWTEATTEAWLRRFELKVD